MRAMFKINNDKKKKTKQRKEKWSTAKKKSSYSCPPGANGKGASDTVYYFVIEGH